MSITRYRRTLLTGGTASAVDGIDGDLLNDGDICEFYSVSDTFDTYRLDADSGAAENSPWIIAPDTNPGSKRWILVNPVSLVDSNLGKSYGVDSIGGGKEFIRLAFDSGIRGLDRNGFNHSMLRMANVSGIDAGVYNFMLLGSSTIGWISIPCMLDLVANNIVDVANVGNIANALCDTRLVQQFTSTDRKVAVATIDDEGNLIDRLTFENYADVTKTYFMFTKVGINTQTPTAQHLTIGTEPLEFNAYVGVRGPFNAVEWGHSAIGYGAVLGAEGSSGTPFIAFNCFADVDKVDKYQTTGQLGSVIRHTAGYLFISRVTNNNAENQTPVNTMTLDPNGKVGIGTTVPNSQLEIIAFDTTMKNLCLAVSADHTANIFEVIVDNANKVAIDCDGKVGIGTQTPTADYLSLGGCTLEFSPSLGVRNQYNSVEFGHPTTGYAGTLGGESNAGAPFVGFQCGHGTNADTYKTTGQLGSVIRHLSGSLFFDRIVNNNADNQSPTNTMTLDSSGNVGIGITSINAAALLHLSSTTKGFLPPVMTATQKGNISSPPEGLVVYDSTNHKLCVYTGSGWETVTSA